ncbi:MAG: hypothetical protein EOP46_03710 [Sphingobacteriaceae bacterium]|nr:MAG: hypothetical protein EOP46_03710 [Sphingobacteriaceae bacterium]
MKNAFKLGFLALAVSLSVAACKGSASGEGDTTGTDTTVVDTTVVDTTVVDTTVVDTTKADSTM